MKLVLKYFLTYVLSLILLALSIQLLGMFNIIWGLTVLKLIINFGACHFILLHLVPWIRNLVFGHDLEK